MSNRIVRKPHIWDLHIHTPIGTPTKKNYDGCSNVEFIDKLLSLYDAAANKIDMISFTDHNQINVEAYEVFMNKSTIAIIPGIEMDIYLRSDDRVFKHIIFYFPEKELENLSELNTIIQKYRSENEKVVFESFVMELIQNGKQFAVSPHAFKQDKRGIEYNWSDPDTADKGYRKFSGLFFPFWEAAGTSEIVRAIEFLNDRSADAADEQAIIAFSDSADFTKVKKYIDNPHQYFLCLNSFKGLLLAGSDSSRIINNIENRLISTPSEKIKKVKIKTDLNNSNEEKTVIELSDRLTAIIGGRGKGKSALLDAIVYAINPELITDSNRSRFVKKFEADVENFNETRMVSDLNIQYFSQSYINSLFSGNSSNNLYAYFKSYFDQSTSITNDITELTKRKIESQQKRKRLIESQNIADDIDNLRETDKARVYPSIKRVRPNYYDVYDKKSGQGFDKVLKKALPNNNLLWSNSNVQQAFSAFIGELVYTLVSINYEEKLNKEYSKIIRNRIERAKQAQNKQEELKAKSREKLEKKLRSVYLQEMQRVIQVNELYDIPVECSKFKMDYSSQKGEDNNRFYFITFANIEHPVEFGKRMICDALDKRMVKNPYLLTNEEIFMKYAFDESIVNQLSGQYDLLTLQTDIDSFNGIKHDLEHKIVYCSGSGMVDLHNTSPGTQTNAIMELMLHSEATTPMFLDQPEDNIDNEARFKKLTKWIKKQKSQRQIIVVTHDANVVINGDAECVIIADHDEQSFKYTYGALEYENILDRASVILDGGKSAIRKRIEKYGE